MSALHRRIGFRKTMSKEEKDALKEKVLSHSFVDKKDKPQRKKKGDDLS